MNASLTDNGREKAARGKPGPLPKSIVKHRRQSFWQIGVPLGIGVAAILTLAVLAALAASAGSPELIRWTNISLIFLIIPAAGSALAFLIIFGGLAFLVGRLLGIVPTYTQKGQALARSLSGKVENWSDRAANPFISIRSSWAGFLTLWRKVF